MMIEKLKKIQSKLIDHTLYVLEGGITGEEEPVAPLVQSIVKLQEYLDNKEQKEKINTKPKSDHWYKIPDFFEQPIIEPLYLEKLGPLDWMKEKRKERKLTQLQLSRVVEVTQWTISLVERGIRRPDDHLAKKLSTILDVPIEKFLEHKYEEELREERKMQ